MNTAPFQSAPREIRQVLENSRLFRGLRPEFIADIASSATRKTLGNNEILFQKGDPADALWGVLSGRVVIEVSTDDGKEMVLDSFGEGEVFGEVGVLDFGPRRVEARSTQKSELFRLERKSLLKHLQNSPELCFRVFSLLCSHLRDTTENLEDTALHKLPNRLAKRLILLAADSSIGEDKIVKIAQSDLAGMLGVHRQAVNKHLREFEKDGLIVLRRQLIEIVDHQALIDIASPGQNGIKAVWGTENLPTLEYKAFTFRAPHIDGSTPQEPHLAGLIAIDAAEYSRSLMTDAAGTLKQIETGLLTVEQAIEKHEGHTVWHTGDRVLAEFPDAQRATQVAMAIQEQVNPVGGDKEESLFRIGVHYGEVLTGDHSIFGAAVNTVIRLTQLSRAGGIAISGAAREALENREQLQLHFLGHHELKNVPGTIPVYSARSIPLIKRLTLRAGSLVPRRLRPLAVTLVAALAVAGIWMAGDWMGRRSMPTPVLPLSIAVLPFSSDGDPKLEYLAEGIPQEIRASLSVIPGMHVIGRESSDYYKSRAASTEEIGRTLGVAWLLQGDFESTEKGIQLITRLLDTANSEVAWEEQFDTSQENYAGFGLGILNGVARTMGILDEQGISLPGVVPLTSNSEAYELYLKAQHLRSNPSRERYLEAFSLLQQAVELDSAFAEAHAIISKFHVTGVLAQQDGLTQNTRNELARESLNKAISLKPDSPVVLAVASASRWLSGDYDAALALADKAYGIDPNNEEALYAQRMVKIVQLDLAGAFRISQRLLVLNPLSLEAMQSVQNGFKMRGQYQEAMAIVNRALALYPEDEALWVHSWVANIKLEMGDRVGAIDSYLKGLPATNPIDLWTGLDYSQQRLDEFQQWWSHATLVYLEEYDQVREIIKHRYDDSEANAEWLSSAEYMVYRGELEALAGDYISAAEYFDRAGIAELEPETDTKLTSLRPWGRVNTMADERQSHFSLAMLLAYRQSGQHEKAESTAKKIEYVIAEYRKVLATVSDQGQFNDLYKEAQLHAIEGRTAQALNTLRNWIDHGTIFTYISWDPYFDSLRGNSQFEAIVAEVESKLADVRARFHAQQIVLADTGER